MSDHSENLGLAPMIAESNPDLLKTEFGRQVHDLVKSGHGGEAYNAWGEFMLKRQDPLKGNDAIVRSMWERITTSAEKYNEPGKFTALIGFEGTSSPSGNNLHRNVIFAKKLTRSNVTPQFAFKWCEAISAHAIGSVAMFWVIQRSAAIW